MNAEAQPGRHGRTGAMVAEAGEAYLLVNRGPQTTGDDRSLRLDAGRRRRMVGDGWHGRRRGDARHNGLRAGAKWSNVATRRAHLVEEHPSGQLVLVKPLLRRVRQRMDDRDLVRTKVEARGKIGAGGSGAVLPGGRGRRLDAHGCLALGVGPREDA